MIEESKVRSIKHTVEENSQVLERVVDSIVQKYNKELDEEVEKIKLLLDDKTTLDDSEIEHLVMRIPVFMYYASNGIETLGVESDMAKAVKLDIYNQRYMESSGTIKDKEANASYLTLNESMIEIAFQRAYKKLKTKLEMAEHVFSGAKKVLTKRMQDTEMVIKDKYN